MNTFKVKFTENINDIQTPEQVHTFVHMYNVDNTTSLISYHDLTERTHLHDVLELFIHISKSELTWKIDNPKLVYYWIQ